MIYPDCKRVLSSLGINEEALNKIFLPFQSITCPKDHHILTIGDTFQNVYLITEGSLRLYYLTPEGNESNKQFYFNNDFLFPVAPIAREHPSLFGIVTCEQTKLLSIPLTKFKQTLQQLTVWHSFYTVYLEWLANIKVMREHHLLTLNSVQRIQHLNIDEPNVMQKIPDYHIASYLGMSPVTFSRMKSVALSE